MSRSSHLRRFACALIAAVVTLPGIAAGTGEPPAPALHADLLDGSRYALADSRGTVTLLAFWSPQSLASRKSIGELNRFATAYQTRGVNTIAVSTTANAQALRDFVAQRGLSVPVAMLSEHNLGSLPEYRLPIVYVFDRDGRIHARHEGLYSHRILERLVLPLLSAEKEAAR